MKRARRNLDQPQAERRKHPTGEPTSRVLAIRYLAGGGSIPIQVGTLQTPKSGHSPSPRPVDTHPRSERRRRYGGWLPVTVGQEFSFGGAASGHSL